jgi:hypothetical protein
MTGVIFAVSLLVMAILVAVIGGLVVAHFQLARRVTALDDRVTSVDTKANRLGARITAQEIKGLQHESQEQEVVAVNGTAAHPDAHGGDQPAPARKKAHLSLYLFGSAVAAATGEAVREAWTYHRAATVTVATVAAVTTATAALVFAGPTRIDGNSAPATPTSETPIPRRPSPSSSPHEGGSSPQPSDTPSPQPTQPSWTPTPSLGPGDIGAAGSAPNDGAPADETPTPTTSAGEQGGDRRPRGHGDPARPSRPRGHGDDDGQQGDQDEHTQHGNSDRGHQQQNGNRCVLPVELPLLNMNVQVLDLVC